MGFIDSSYIIKHYESTLVCSSNTTLHSLVGELRKVRKPVKAMSLLGAEGDPLGGGGDLVSTSPGYKCVLKSERHGSASSE